MWPPDKQKPQIYNYSGWIINGGRLTIMLAYAQGETSLWWDHHDMGSQMWCALSWNLLQDGLSASVMHRVDFMISIHANVTGFYQSQPLECINMTVLLAKDISPATLLKAPQESIGSNWVRLMQWAASWCCKLQAMAELRRWVFRPQSVSTAIYCIYSSLYADQSWIWRPDIQSVATCRDVWGRALFPDVIWWWKGLWYYRLNRW